MNFQFQIPACKRLSVAMAGRSIFNFQFLFLVSCFLFLSYQQAFAQATTSCVVTKIGNPSGNTPLPPECTISDSGGSPGQYFFPLGSASVVTAVSTEMASYGGSYSYSGHIEHAGLDIGVPYQQRVPVYAITDGEVILSTGSHEGCRHVVSGCTMKIKHNTDSLISVYTHVNPYFGVGAKVKKGDKIALAHDWVGISTMDHLHFELRQQATNYNVNPRNYFPELQRFPASPSYNGNVRQHAASRGILLEPQGEWAEMFANHPPCRAPLVCWAY